MKAHMHTFQYNLRHKNLEHTYFFCSKAFGDVFVSLCHKNESECLRDICSGSLHSMPFKGVGEKNKTFWSVSRRRIHCRSASRAFHAHASSTETTQLRVALMTPAGHAGWISKTHISLFMYNVHRSGEADAQKTSRDQTSAGAASDAPFCFSRKAILLSSDSPALLHWPIYSGPFSRRFRDAEPVWCPGGGSPAPLPALAPCLRQLFSKRRLLRNLK